MPTSLLTPTQARFLEAFYRNSRSGASERFYLSGGTALAAYYLQHRYSDDLDFFTRDREPLRITDAPIAAAATACSLEIDRVERHDTIVRYALSGDRVPDHALKKVEMIFDTPPYFAPPVAFGNVLVDALLSIAVNKMVALGRLEPKDYIDLYLIVQSGSHRIEDLVPLAGQKDPGMTPWVIAGQFAQVERLPNLAEFQAGYMVTVVEQTELIRFYLDWAARLFSLFPPRAQE